MANILVVDDSPSMRQFVEMAIKMGGHSAVSASDGREGLSKAKLAKFDAIITDMNMPIMSGIDFTSAIRQFPNYRFTPVLMLTTESDPDSKAKAAGVTGWIVKSFQPDNLIKILAKVI
ncbi:MAG: response regulator [Gammaproteobacteria bacterium CG22_combo_CG10-13_8_21_14_all_40_8]|nr:MAG: response regulator [Gammaproteobacteria bacterium CG22_combo_CG10-13_8_21_14_all_40_8]